MFGTTLHTYCLMHIHYHLLIEITKENLSKFMRQLGYKESVEAPNIDTKLKEEDLVKMFERITEIKKRNETIAKAYTQGYSQHRIAKVLGLAQSTVNGIVKRMKR